MSIPGRSEFFSLLQICVAQADESGTTLALLIIDIRRFRRVNNLYGYRLGDELLEALAQRIQRVIREHDRLLRIGNTEFALLVPGLRNSKIAELAANRVLHCSQDTFEIMGREITVDIAMGVALYPNAGAAETLLKQAEMALVEAKQRGQAYHIHTETPEVDDDGDWDMESELSAALVKNELEIFFQPKVNLKTGAPYGAESLVRWHHAIHGRVSPELFVDVAERTGKIQELSWYCVNTALRHAAQWTDRFGPLTVAVNLSPTILHHQELVPFVLGALNIWGVPAQRLILEITESGVMADPEFSAAMLEELKRIGTRVSIDDFGTGYSSLAYFKRIPACELKIDKSFVSNMMNDEADRTLVETMISLAHGFKMSVVAEGVEDQATYQALREMGCDYAQGYYISRPMDSQAYGRWLEAYPPVKG